MKKGLKLLEIEVKCFELAHVALERWDITDGNGALGTNFKDITFREFFMNIFFWKFRN